MFHKSMVKSTIAHTIEESRGGEESDGESIAQAQELSVPSLH